MTHLSFTALKEEALRLGLNDLGIVSASESNTWHIFADWIDCGQGGEMMWLRNQCEARRHPDSVLNGVRTLFIAVLTLSELQKISQAERPFKGKIETQKHFKELIPYSVCLDYHLVLKTKLNLLAVYLKKHFPNEKFRGVADTAPILEKEWGERAGLGCIARNSLLLHPRFGTAFFLGILLTTIDPEHFTDIPQKKSLPDPCQNCFRCRESCPTDALNPNRTLNASRCLNYWTIEYKGKEIPIEIRQRLGNRVFGCDICQRVCPKNVDIHSLIPIASETISEMTNEQFTELFAERPIERLGLERLKRNNQGGSESLENE